MHCRGNQGLAARAHARGAPDDCRKQPLSGRPHPCMGLFLVWLASSVTLTVVQLHASTQSDVLVLLGLRALPAEGPWKGGGS